MLSQYPNQLEAQFANLSHAGDLGPALESSADRSAEYKVKSVDGTDATILLLCLPAVPSADVASESFGI